MRRISNEFMHPDLIDRATAIDARAREEPEGEDEGEEDEDEEEDDQEGDDDGDSDGYSE